VDKQEATRYWRDNMRLIGVLLAIWAAVSLGAGILLVEWFNRVQVGAVPLGFWMAQQGAIFIFVVLIFGYARAMDRIDRRHHADE
jgi:putative solute:sodium symporter small subunit